MNESSWILARELPSIIVIIIIIIIIIHRHFLSGLCSKKTIARTTVLEEEIMTRKEKVIKVKQFRSSGGTSMSSACS